MRYLRVTLHPDRDALHPMHRFAIDHGGYDRYELRHWGADEQLRFTGIFQISGPREPYEQRLDTVESLDTYEISEGHGDSFALYVIEDQEDVDQRLSAAFSQGSLVILPPVEYRLDGTIGVQVVGATEHVQAAVETTPSPISVEVEHVGTYRADRLPGGVNLTERQHEAVAAAVAVGYYDSPREGTVENVADRLGCSTGTAAEHLRKAEAAVMGRIVE